MRESDHFKELGIHWWIILKYILKKGMEAWNGLIWIRTGRGGKLC